MAICRLLKITVFCTLFFTSACSHSEYGSLVGAGVLPVSTTNAYVGTNLFLATEFEKSRVLFEFFRSRGAPLALERKSETSLVFYYPKEKEFFLADLVIDEFKYNWITKGPFKMGRAEFLKIANLTGIVEDPLFSSKGQVFRFKERIAPTPTQIVVIQTPKPKKTTTKKKPQPPVLEVNKETPTPTPLPSKLNFDQMAIQMSRGFAERAPNGDLIHTVTKEGETMRKLAEWYTGSPTNGDVLASMNGVSADAEIVVGTRIAIPEHLVTQFKALK